MAAGQNTFEGGTDGVTISDANSGGASGDATNGTTVGGGNVCEYDTARARGAVSAHFLMPATVTNQTYLQWRSMGLGQGDVWFAVDLNLQALPVGNWFYIIRVQDSSLVALGRLGLRSDGLLRFDNNAGTEVTALRGTIAIPVDQWVRIELHINQTAGSAEWWSYFNPDSNAANETKSVGSGIALGSTAVESIGSGAISTLTNLNNAEWWIDNIRWSNVAKLGPAGPRARRTYMRLYGPGHLGTSATALYTAPPDANAKIRHIRVNNPSGSARTFTMSIGTDAAGTRIFDGTSIPAGVAFDTRRGAEFDLAAGETLYGYADASATLVAIVDGIEQRFV